MLAALLVAIPLSLAGCVASDDVAGLDAEIAWIDHPTTATVGESFEVTYQLQGADALIEQTAVHYGPESVDDPDGPDAYPHEAGKRENVELPQEFTVEITPDEPGVIYVAARAAGLGTELWTPELRIPVEGGPQPSDVLRIVVEAEPVDNTTVALAYDITKGPAELELLEAYASDEPVDEANVSAYEDDALAFTEDPDAQGTIEVEPASDDRFVRLRVVDANGKQAWSDEIDLRTIGFGLLADHLVTVEELGVPPMRFAPAEITIRVGETVEWVNDGQLDHTVTFEELNGTSDLELADLAPGDSVNWTFTEPGEYRYRDTRNSVDYEVGMVGLIRVSAS